ncbi:MAG TPA: DinB family protein [Dehalococcoidia bacterium]|nr:DinB family protein [Dehalococcoidia bacterium]
MNEPLAQMFRYNRWANLTLLDACRTLDAGHLATRMPGGSGTVGEVLLHLVGGQQTFVLRTQGRQHEGELNRSSAWPGWERLIAIVRETSDALIAIAAALERDTDVALPWQGSVYRYPTSFFLVHALEHGVEHRTEIKLALAQLGIATPDLDGWRFSDAMGYGGPA